MHFCYVYIKTKVWKKWKIEEEFDTLYKKLIDDETKFIIYFRILKYSFDLLLKKIECDLKKNIHNGENQL